MNHGRLVFNSGGTFGSVGTLSRHAYITPERSRSRADDQFRLVRLDVLNGGVLTGTASPDRSGNLSETATSASTVREIELNGSFAGDGTLRSRPYADAVERIDARYGSHGLRPARWCAPVRFRSQIARSVVTSGH